MPGSVKTFRRKEAPGEIGVGFLLQNTNTNNRSRKYLNGLHRKSWKIQLKNADGNTNTNIKGLGKSFRRKERQERWEKAFF